MRKIEQQMVNAVEVNRAWQSGNTQVIPYGADHDGRVLLHGNEIATTRPTDSDTLLIIPNRITFRDWPTVTTRSRLGALGVRANIKNGRAYINGEEL